MKKVTLRNTSKHKLITKGNVVNGVEEGLKLMPGKSVQFPETYGRELAASYSFLVVVEDEISDARDGADTQKDKGSEADMKAAIKKAVAEAVAAEKAKTEALETELEEARVKLEDKGKSPDTAKAVAAPVANPKS